MPQFKNSQYLFAIFFFFYYGYLGVISPYFSLYFDHLGFTAIQISLVMSMLQITRILGPMFWGWLSDLRQDRIGIMRVTGLLSLFIFLGIFYVHAFVGMIIWMFVINTFSSSLTPLGEAATIHALQKKNQFESHYGKLRLWGSIGFMLAVFAGGFWFEAQGIQTLPWVGFVILLFVTAATWMLWEPPLEKREMIKGQMRSIIKKSEVLWFFSSTFWMVFAHSTLYTFYSLYLQKLGFHKQVIGLFWMIAVGAEVLYFYFQKFFYNRFDPYRILGFTFLLGIFRFLVIAFYPSFWPLFIVQLFHAGTFAAHHSASVLLIQKWFKGSTQVRGQALYTMSSYGLGGTMGGVVAGWIWEDYGSKAAFITASFACVLGYLSIMQSARHTKLTNSYIPE
jgi:MFS transporter, PPP family, 3-phenylpropionic acid transporter